MVRLGQRGERLVGLRLRDDVPRCVGHSFAPAATRIAPGSHTRRMGTDQQLQWSAMRGVCSWLRAVGEGFAPKQSATVPAGGNRRSAPSSSRQSATSCGRPRTTQVVDPCNTGFQPRGDGPRPAYV